MTDHLRCSYCRNQASVWIDHSGRRGHEGRRAIRGYQVGACDEHKTCVNFLSHLAHKRTNQKVGSTESK